MFKKINLMTLFLCLISSFGFTQPVQQEINPNNILKDQFIVIFNKKLPAPAVEARNIARRNNGQLQYIYQKVINGFALRVSENAVENIKRNPNVEDVYPDFVIRLNSQDNPTWGLDRIDQVNLPLDDRYISNTTGKNVNAYIIDTGIVPTHNDFENRAQIGFDAFDGTSYDDEYNGLDCNGHGTHVAGTVGSKTYGVAKQSNLIGIRVLNCSGSGTASGVIKGIDWVAINAEKPAVANMSLGGGAYSLLDQAVANAVANGITFVVAAGNENQDACTKSPAREADAITVAASTQTDSRASFSNYGNCVDIFAPGVSIQSTWYTSNSSVASLSGTSMASPHVAGVAALFLEINPSATPDQVANELATNSVKNKITNSKTSHNDLVQVFPEDTTPEPNQEPSAAFTYTINDFSVKFVDQSTDSDGTIVSFAWNFGNGITSNIQNPTISYLKAGTYTVSLTVTDNDGAIDTATKLITITEEPIPNESPKAAFTFTVTGSSASFTNQSIDSDGTIESYGWDFGNGVTSTLINPTITYENPGNYSVKLTVTDNDGATATITKTITIEEDSEPTPVMSLSGNIFRERGRVHLDLTWLGATTTQIDIYINNTLYTTTSNDGNIIINTGERGSNSYSVQVCEKATTSVCSNIIQLDI